MDFLWISSLQISSFWIARSATTTLAELPELLEQFVPQLGAYRDRLVQQEPRSHCSHWCLGMDGK